MNGQRGLTWRTWLGAMLGAMLGVLAVLSPLAVAEESADDSDDHIQALIQDLGSPDFEVREAAEAALKEIGPEAMEALQQAAADPSPEVRNRAKRILDDIGNPAEERREEVRQQARAAFLRGDFPVMLRYQQHLAGLTNPSPLDLLWLGHAHRLLEQWPEAVAAYQRAMTRVDETRKQVRKMEDADMAMRPETFFNPEVLALRIGRIQRDVLNDLAGAEATFLAVAKKEGQLNRTVAELQAEWVKIGGEPPRRSVPLKVNSLRALHELALTHVRMGKLTEAAEELSRFNLIQLVHYNEARELDIESLVRLHRDWPAELPPPAPALHGLTELTPERPEISVDVSKSASPDAAPHIYQSSGIGEYRQRHFGFVPAPGSAPVPPVPPVLWLTRSKDGETWDPPRPIETNNTRPDEVLQLLRSPDGQCRMLYLDQLGSAERFARLTALTDLNFKQAFGHEVDDPHLTVEPTGKLHLVFRGARHSIYYTSSTDARTWTEPLQIIDGPSNGYPQNPQMVLAGNRAAVLYEDVKGDAWLRRIDFGERLVNRPVKIADRQAPLAGARMILDDKQVMLIGGNDAVWVLSAEIDAVLGTE